MKEGYIVWNESNCKSEFFGVYKTWEKALRQFRKVIRNRFGRCPRNYEDILDFLVENGDGDESYKISWFNEFNKKEK